MRDALMPTYLTPTEARTLEFITGHIRETGGVSPTFSRIMHEIGHRSKSKIGFILDDLERKGKIRRLGRRARAIEVVDRVPVVRFPRATYFKWDDDAQELREWQP